MKYLATCLLLASVFASGCRKSPDDLAKQAEAEIQRGRFPEAVIEYRQALQKDPTRGDLRTKLADLYLRMGDAPNAMGEYIRAADALPRDAQAQIKAAAFLVRARQFEEARTLALKAVALDPKSAEALIILGNAISGLSDFDEALTNYQDALALAPNQDAAYTNIGSIQFARGQRAEAELSFKKAVDLSPRSIPARLALANFLWATNDVPGAEKALKEALALDPSNLAAARALGMFLVATNRSKEADPYFQSIAKSSDDKTRFDLADYDIATGRLDEAKSVLNALAATDKHFAAATTRLAAIDEIQGSRAQALQKLRTVTEKFPNEFPARLLSARLLLADGKRAEAMTEANLIVSKDPTSRTAGDAYVVIARIQAASDRPADAIKSYREAVRLQPQPLAADLGLASLLLKALAFDDARGYAQSALTIDPGNAEARSLLVRVNLAQNDKANAAKELGALKKDYPNSPTVLNLLAVEQLAGGNTEAARALYARALQSSPRDFEALTGLVRLALDGGRTAEALERVEAGLRIGGASGDLLCLAAQTYAAAGDTTRAEALLKQAIEQEPARLEAYGLLGSLFGRQGRLGEAMEQFRSVVERDPRSVSGNTMIGILFEGQRQMAEAEKQYQRVLTIDPNAAVAANNLAWIYVSTGRDLEEALQLAQTAQQQLPDDPHVNDTLGWIYYKKKMIPLAIRHLEASVKSAPDDAVGIFHLGMAYWQAGFINKAKDALARALAIKDDFDGAADAKRLLGKS